MSRKYPPPPKGLAEGGRELWRDLIKFGPFRADHLRILRDCVRECDLIDRMEEEMRDGQMIVLGSMKQPTANPMAGELRQHRVALSGLLRALELPAVDLDATDEARAARSSALDEAERRWAK